MTIELPDWVPPIDTQIVPVTFKAGSDGGRANQFARIIVRIDGRDLPMLFDTGAMTVLMPAALVTIADDGPALRATSFVVADVVAEWRRRHPTWRVIERADTSGGMNRAGIAGGPNS